MRSFLDIPPDSHFSLQNLPYGIFSTVAEPAPRVGVAVGDWVLDLSVLQDEGLLDGPWSHERPAFRQSTLNAFMALGRPAWAEARRRLQALLAVDNPALRDDEAVRARAFRRQDDVTMHLPAAIGDYTDFYSSREHAANVGAMFRDPDNPILPNWLHLPVAYHGRASSVILSGVDVRRPQGQTHPKGVAGPVFGPTRALDFELELASFVGPGNPLGRPIPIEDAKEHLFGMVLMNDWSARDIQAWEYRPLGPFLAKNFATSISPWVVTFDALAPFRCAGPGQEPAPLPYLQTAEGWAYDIRLEAYLQTPAMSKPARITRTNFKGLYWNVHQQLAHHTVTGCNLQPGDLLGSGTVSGPEPGAYGSLLELTWGGTRPLQLPSGEERRYLEDGDRLTLTGWCQGDGYRVGFGAVTAQILRS
jgi:fumarylacetoacetase